MCLPVSDNVLGIEKNGEKQKQNSTCSLMFWTSIFKEAKWQRTEKWLIFNYDKCFVGWGKNEEQEGVKKRWRKGVREIGGIYFTQPGHGVDIFILRSLRLPIWIWNNEAQKAWRENTQFCFHTVLWLLCCIFFENTAE